jgi:fucose permease
MANALFTTLAMEVSVLPRSLASGAYNFLRWSGAAIAPALSGFIGQTVGMTIPFFLAGLVVIAGIFALSVKGRVLKEALNHTQGEVGIGREETGLNNG